MTGSKRRAGRRRGRFALLGAVAAIAALAYGASSAQAATVGFSATYDDAALNVSGLTFDILEPPNTATMTGTIDNGTGAFTVPAAGFVFPQFSGEALPGVPVTVNFSAVDPIAGTLNLGTGALTTTLSTYHANVQALGGNCDYDIDLAYSTAAGSPFNGDPFTVAGTDPITISSGIIQTGWPADYFTPDPDASCATINGLVAGAGGMAIANGFDLTPAAPPTTTPPATTPPVTSNAAALKKCLKKAKKIKDKVKRKKAIKKCKKKFG
jgi:hypothetical protein